MALEDLIAFGHDGALPSTKDQNLAQGHIENLIQRDVQPLGNVFVGLQIHTAGIHHGIAVIDDRCGVVFPIDGGELRLGLDQQHDGNQRFAKNTNILLEPLYFTSRCEVIADHLDRNRQPAVRLLLGELKELLEHLSVERIDKAVQSWIDCRG